MPPTPTILSLWGHAATRVLTLRGFFGRGLTPKQSLATGCHSSTTLARALTKTPLDEAAAAGGVRLSQSVHVDDISQEAQGTEEEVYATLSEAGRELIHQFDLRGLTVSSKSQLIATDKALAKRLQTAFKQAGEQWNIQRLPLTWAAHALQIPSGALRFSRPGSPNLVRE